MSDTADLLADRFIQTGGPHAIDLATGECVTIVMSTAGGAAEMSRWSVRCDVLARLHHHALATLVDFGRCGDTHRFEAWRCGLPWTGPAAVGERALRLARLFLRANGLSDDALTRASLRVWHGRVVVQPENETGYEAGHTCGDIVAREPAEHGLCRIERPEVTALFDVFRETTGVRLRAITLWGPAGSGIDVSLRELSRTARLNGFVPVSLEQVDRTLAQRLRNRSLFLIARSGAGWSGLLEWTLRSPKAHVLMFAGESEVPDTSNVAIKRVKPEILEAALRPRIDRSADAGRVLRAAARSEGRPGRFVRLLWGLERVEPHRGSAAAVSVAAERQASYGQVVSPGVADAEEKSVTGRELPLLAGPRKCEELRQRMQAAIDLLRRGRRAPGERTLRATVAALARRQDWEGAADGTVALASSVLGRGRPSEAAKVLSEAHTFIEHDEGSAAGLDLGVLSGAASIDRGRLDEAENVLRSTEAVARSRHDVARLAVSRLVLARCWFWRGRHAEADHLLRSVSLPSLSPPLAIRVALTLSRVAVGLKELSTAVSGAMDAQAAAKDLDDPSLEADAAYAAAFVHLAVGDLAAVEADVTRCVALARRARCPLRALKARLLAAEGARRQGRFAAVDRLLDRAHQLLNRTLPITVSARCALLKELAGADTTGRAAPETIRTQEIVKRHVSATGLTALTLFVSAESEPVRSIRSAMEDAVEILRFCQTAEDDAAVLMEVCVKVRARLRATGLTLFALDRAGTIVLASDGSRIDPSIAERVVTARQSIAPHACDGSIQGGVPLRYGGELLGVLAARWTVASPPDALQVGMVLAMAATAAGPAVAGAMARQSRVAAPGGTELLGVSAAMADVRRAVERAATAPFAALIEGESGSGKELVARALHRQGPRRDRAWCAVNCAALPDDLVEAELFGHARGAFTGALAERPGVFEEAHNGTLFLDEVGELSARAQAKLLRTIQEGDVRRVGENVARRVDVRLVSATNRDLRAEAEAGRFRRDLLYRLDVIRIRVPPLRERREDIGPLVEHFWGKAAERIGSRAILSGSCLASLTRYDWPGNVRELQNVLAALAVRSAKRGVISDSALPPAFGTVEAAESWRLDAARRTFEERFVRAALVRSGGHRARAADELGITRQGLTKLMTRLGIGD